jgi:DNA-binding MarR family transcriptional regulator
VNDLPKQEDLAALRMLEEIDRDPSTSQRKLSRSLGLSLGLTNLMIRRMARKAWIKVTTIPGHRVVYALTPRGVAEKVRKTRDFVRLSLRYTFDMRRLVSDRIRETGRARPRVASWGAPELAIVVKDAAAEVSGTYLGEADASRRADVIVLLAPAPPGLKEAWEKGGSAVVDLT